MDTVLNAIETTGTVDEDGQLRLDAPLSMEPSRVRVIVLARQKVEYDDSEISEEAWLKALARNPAFDWLADPEEDIYTKEDGTPFIANEG